MKLVLVISGVLALGTWAGADDTRYAGEVTARKLNLRAGPGEAYQTVLRIKQGDRVIVIGRHPNSPSWVQVEVPAGYGAWVFADLLKIEGKVATVRRDRVQIRPRSTTRYHQLAGVLNRGEKVQVLGKRATKEGTWVQVKVPRRVPLFAHRDFLKNVGPASLAEPKVQKPAKTGIKAPGAPEPVDAEAARRFKVLDTEVQKALKESKRGADLDPIGKALAEFDSSSLSMEMRERKLVLQSQILKRQRVLSIRDLQSRKKELKANLKKELERIDARYQKRLAQIRADAKKKKEAFVATGIIQHRPDLFGKHPSYRLEHGGKIQYYLIATDYDLRKFEGKRVGVRGILDPESGTGLYTVIVKSLEILGDR